MKNVKIVRGLVIVIGFILVLTNIENGNWNMITLGMTLIALTHLGSIVHFVTNFKEICGLK